MMWPDQPYHSVTATSLTANAIKSFSPLRELTANANTKANNHYNPRIPLYAYSYEEHTACPLVTLLLYVQYVPAMVSLYDCHRRRGELSTGCFFPGWGGEVATLMQLGGAHGVPSRYTINTSIYTAWSNS